MKGLIALSLAAVASAAPAFNTETIHGDAAPILSSANAEEVPGAYIIKFKDHVDEKAASDHHSWVNSIHDAWTKTLPENKDERILELRKRGFGLELSSDVFKGLKHTYKIGSGFVGYAGHFDDSIIEQVRRHPDVSISPHFHQFHRFHFAFVDKAAACRLSGMRGLAPRFWRLIAEGSC